MAVGDHSRPMTPTACGARAALALSLAAALAPACAPAPPGARRGDRAVILSSEPGAAAGAPRAREAPTDEELERQVERALGLVKDGAAPGLVRAVGARVAAASPRAEVPYRFAVVDRPEPNAFALPTGQIYVSRGLLALLCGPDELAGVLGHEVAHVAARHAEGRARQAAAATLLSTLSVLAAGLGASSGRDAALAGPASQAAAAASVAAYSREQEREADRLGQDLAAAAGYAPEGLPRALRALDHERRLREGASPLPRFFDTHPGGTERFAAAASRSAEADAEADPAAREAFLRALDGLVVGPDPAGGVFDGSRFVHPGLDLVLRFPEGWTLTNAPAAVVAVSPERDASIALELAGPAASLEARVRADAGARGLAAVAFDALRIGGAPAMRVVGVAPTEIEAGLPTGPGRVALDVTWVARSDAIYRVTGRASEERFVRHAGSFLAAAKSLRRLTAPERERVRVLRLRLVRARSGEDLAALARRTGTSWTPAEIALANGLAGGGGPGGGTLVKLALAEPWASGAPAPAASPPAPDPR
jgi:predicted Zn-dependent protease